MDVHETMKVAHERYGELLQRLADNPVDHSKDQLEKREEALDELTQQAQELDMGY